MVIFENYLIPFPWHMLAAVLRKVFGADADKPEDEADLSHVHIDENAHEERKAYKQKIGRWRAAALLVTSCKIPFH